MATTKNTAVQETEATPKRDTVKGTPETLDRVFAAVKAAGDNGITLKELEEKTGLRYRVLHNLTWKLEGSPEPKTSHPNYGTPRKPDEAKIARKDGNRIRYVAK